MLDELRKDDDSFDFDEDVSLESDEPEVPQRHLFLGMTAVERMFIAVFIFLNVVVLGLAFLLATGRIAF
ncbi:MAG: hypothetical protein JNM70_18085 [Anaerolineae bacterium]|nr:hypothetical protein [Anaerolineae bacterium]